MRAVSPAELRLAEPVDADALARLWHDAWQDGHAGLVPASLAPHRTLASFRQRIGPLIDRSIVIEAAGDIAGFAAIEGAELYQFHLAAWARGRGLANRLMTRVEDTFLENGVRRPFVLCAAGNQRALRFYLRSGWTDTGVAPKAVTTPDGPVAIDCHRLEKDLAGG